MAALDTPPPPDGFTVDAGLPPPPEGFSVDGGNAASGALGTALHYGGLAARAGVQAVPAALGGLPALLLDAANSATNIPLEGYNAAVPTLNKYFGTDLSKSPLYDPWAHSKALNAVGEKMADVIGTSKPETKMESALTDVGTAGASALGGAGVAKALSSVLAGAPQTAGAVGKFFETLADSPTAQAIGASASAGATKVAQSMGITDPKILGLIALGTAPLVGVPVTAAERGAMGAVQSVKPFTNAGQEQIVGKALNSIATRPSETAATLANAEEIIPGSRPTVAQASGDAGMINSDTAIRGLEGGSAIPERMSEQNSARMGALNKIAADEDTLNYATKKRDNTYDDYAEPAFADKSPVGVNPDPVLDTINSIRRSRAGVRTIVQQAMDQVNDRVQNLLNSNTHDSTDPQNLYELRKDLADLRNGKYNTDKSDFKLAKGEIGQVINKLDGIIDNGAPGYKDYMSLYSKRSIPLDQLEALQDIRKRAVFPTTDPVTQQPILSNAKFQNLLKSNMDDGLNLRGQGVGGAKLSDSQLSTLDRIASDLDRGSATTAATMRGPGSDTYKNLSTAAVIGRILGDKTGALVNDTAFGKTMGNLNFLYRVPDRQIQEMMVQAWLDPKLASRLMQSASSHNITEVADALKDRVAAGLTSQSLYGKPAQ